MLSWFIAVGAGLLAAAIAYGRSAVAARVLPLAMLRAGTAMLLVALLLDAPAARAPLTRPDVALDASESVTRGMRGSNACWRAALDSADAAGGVTLRFGERLNTGGGSAPPTDRASALRPVADRAAATGRPVVVVTDGELQDGELAATLPAGSRTVAIACHSGADVAVAELNAPRALLVGDTVAVRVTLMAGSRGGPAGRLELMLGDSPLAIANVAPLAPWAESVMDLRGVAGGREGAAVLRAVYRGARDVEPRNDTLSLGVEITTAAAAVFVSTAPDYDAREAVAALRGVTSLPTRAYYRVAVDEWRSDAGLAPVTEAAVRTAVQRAPLVVLHGDTAVFGPPRAATRASLLLFAPPATDEGEWFASALPPSPVAGVAAAFPFDSLSPLNVAPPAAMPRGEWQGLVTTRAGSPNDRRVALVGWDEPRRIAVLGASGFWRWRFRGGVRADAYAALFGTLYDWLSAGRSDRRAAVPDSVPQRAGTPVRWLRGAASDSVVRITLRRRNATGRVQSVSLRFAPGVTVAESPALPPGEYVAEVPGGSVLFAVNASAEMVPRRPTVRSGDVGGVIPAGDAASLRDEGWLYGLVIAGFCAEWLLRRRVGLR